MEHAEQLRKDSNTAVDKDSELTQLLIPRVLECASDARVSQLRSVALDFLRACLPAVKRSADAAREVQRALDNLISSEKDAPVQAKAAALRALL